MSDAEVGQCCFCQEPCNIHSQACGRCMRNGSMFAAAGLVHAPRPSLVFTEKQELRVREIITEMLEEERESLARKRRRLQSTEETENSD